MIVSIDKQIIGVVLLVGLDLGLLISLILGFDPGLLLVIMLIPSLIVGKICIHRLNKLIEEQESEELAEDLADDIDEICWRTGWIATVLFVVLSFLSFSLEFSIFG